MSIETTRQGTKRVRVIVDGVREDVGIVATDEEARKLERAVQDGAAKGPGGITLRKWGAKWLDQRELDGVRGIATERGRWSTHIETASFIDRPLVMITAADVEAWIRSLPRKKISTPYHEPRPLSPKTIKEAISLLRMCFAAARGKHVSGNVVEDCAEAIKRVTRKRGAAATAEPWTYLEPKEQDRLRSCAAIPETHRLMIAFAMLTGLRQGEQFNLEVRDVEVARAEPHVFVRYGAKGEPPKNGRTRRVYLSADALAVVKRWLALLPSYAPKNPDGLMFPGPTGARMQPGKTPLVKSKWEPVGAKRKGKCTKIDLFVEYLAAAGIDRHVRWHDLRHSCASSLVAGWWGRRWTLEEVREHLGHTSIQSTQRYTHLGATAIKRAVAETPGRVVQRARRLPAGGKASGERSHPSPCNRSVGRQGLEPWTYGLKAPGVPEELYALTSETGTLAGSNFAARARAALAALSAQDPYAGVMLVRLLEELSEAREGESEDVSAETG